MSQRIDDKIAHLERLLARVRDRSRSLPLHSAARVTSTGSTPFSASSTNAPASPPRASAEIIREQARGEAPPAPASTRRVTLSGDADAVPPASSARLRVGSPFPRVPSDVPPPPASGSIKRSEPGASLQSDAMNDGEGSPEPSPSTPPLAPRPAASERPVSLISASDPRSADIDSDWIGNSDLPAHSGAAGTPSTSEHSVTAWSEVPAASSGPLRSDVVSEPSLHVPSSSRSAASSAPPPDDLAAAVVRRESVGGEVVAFVAAPRTRVPATFGALLDEALALGITTEHS